MRWPRPIDYEELVEDSEASLIRYDNRGGGLSYPAGHDNEAPAYLRAPAFLVLVLLGGQISGAGGRAAVIRGGPHFAVYPGRAIRAPNAFGGFPSEAVVGASAVIGRL